MGANPTSISVESGALINFGMFLVAFRVLTAESPSWRDVLPGAVVATVFWEVLQAVGGWYVARSLKVPVAQVVPITQVESDVAGPNAEVVVLVGQNFAK